MAGYMDSEFGIGPEQVREQHIESFLAYLYDKGVKKTTQARILSGVKSFFNYLLINDRIENLPTEFIDPPKTGRKLPDVLSVAEIQAILDTIDPEQPFRTPQQGDDRNAVQLRPAGFELISLRISDLFFDDGFIRVIGKGDKQRLVPVSRQAVRLIGCYLEQRAGQETDPRSADTLFLNNKGRGLTRVMIFHIIREAAKAAGIAKTISPHTSVTHSPRTCSKEGRASARYRRCSGTNRS